MAMNYRVKMDDCFLMLRRDAIESIALHLITHDQPNYKLLREFVFYNKSPGEFPKPTTNVPDDKFGYMDMDQMAARRSLTMIGSTERYRNYLAEIEKRVYNKVQAEQCAA